MPEEKRPEEPELDQVNARLCDGIKACRSVVANYRALLSADGTRDGGDDESTIQSQPCPPFSS